LQDGSELRLTISRYYTPSGRSIQKPYVLGREEDYEKDYEKRLKSGEFFNADSIKFNDKLKYKTLSGRTVYGGGGITPDVFVARDTTYFTKYLSDLWGKNIIREFALNYANDNMKSLEKLTFKDFNKFFVVNDAMLIDMQRLAKQANVKMRVRDYERSMPYIKAQIKAYIARSVWQRKVNDGLNNEYIQIMAPFDDTFQKSLKHFDKAERMARGELVETLSHSIKK
jgi:carboxyl-terminal processing protease